MKISNIQIIGGGGQGDTSATKLQEMRACVEYIISKYRSIVMMRDNPKEKYISGRTFS